jgi:antitoxin HicB
MPEKSRLSPFSYVALIQECEPGAFLVTFPDVPEAITQGDDEHAAVQAAGDALDAALEGYIELNRDFPAHGNFDQANVRPGLVAVEVAVDPALAARGLLAHAMREQGLSKVGLANRIGRDEKAVRRMLAGRGASLEMTLSALRVLGVRPALAA